MSVVKAFNNDEPFTCEGTTVSKSQLPRRRTVLIRFGENNKLSFTIKT